jgi:hypothetical protein
LYFLYDRRRNSLFTYVFFVDEYGGNVGLAITQAMGLTGMFQWGMRQSTELENQMTSVERYLLNHNLIIHRGNRGGERS